MLLLLACANSDSSTDTVDTSTPGEDPCAAAAAPLDLTWTAAPACTEPVATPSYTDDAAAMGLTGSDTPQAARTAGGTVAVDDFDADGDLDLVLAFLTGEPRLYTREGDHYTRGVLVEGLPAGALPIILTELDGDGRRDLVLAGPPMTMLSVEADGFGRTGTVDREPPIIDLVPLDADQDGEIDLFAAGGIASQSDLSANYDSFLHGDGDEHWTTTALDPTVTGGASFDAFAFDHGGDGDLDVYVVNDLGSQWGPDLLLENEGGTFTDVAAERGVAIVHDGMGGDAGDYNNDGIPDLFLTATGTTTLLQGLPDGSFVDVTAATGADVLPEYWQMAFGGVFFDQDNDGLLDLLVARGDLYNDTQPEPVVDPMAIALLRQSRSEDGTVTFTDLAPGLGMTTEGSWRATVPVDDNGDGVLDLLVTDADAAPAFYRSTGCTANAWIEVEAPPGSRVDVCVAGERRTAWATTESGWAGARPPVTHFGLGANDTVDRVVVTLPSGEVRAADGPIATRQRGRVE